jgi:hypothetical protein
MEVQRHVFVISAPGGEWSASRPGRFIPGERAPGNHWIGDWVGPEVDLDAMEKRKIPSPHREPNPDIPLHSQSLHRQQQQQQ